MKKEVPPSHSSTDTRDENNYFQDSNAVKKTTMNLCVSAHR